jgi:sugar phosphate isomerase/epimerase
LTGFADEAADSMEGQIRATRELGWTHIESRNVDGVNLHDLSEEAFDVVCDQLGTAGIQVNCFGSAIANWGKQIDAPFDSSLAEARRAVPRMLRLNAKLIRIMSFAVLKDREPDDQMEEERFSRLRELVSMFREAGIQPVHENCMNYGGMGWQYTLKLVENVPGLKLVFDTGNPVFTDDRCQAKPYPKQSAWEFYSKVKEHIAYLHIKDGVMKTGEDGAAYCAYSYPGEGSGDVRRIVSDLLAGGYDGGISIEPHLGAVFHDASITSDEESRYASYVEYGRRLETLIREVRGVA